MADSSSSRLTTLTCRRCRFKIPFMLKPGRYRVGCPNCPGKTPVEVTIRKGAYVVTPLMER